MGGKTRMHRDRRLRQLNRTAFDVQRRYNIMQRCTVLSRFSVEKYRFIGLNTLKCVKYYSFIKVLLSIGRIVHLI